ncbi:MAG TPA: hypothetical protein VGK82_10505 [Pyrinomonadaceae bacterium]
MQTKMLAALLSILMFSAACDNSGKAHTVPPSPAAPVAQVRDQGVYAYFKYVEKPKNRKTLQEKLQVWFQENFADAVPQKRP